MATLCRPDFPELIDYTVLDVDGVLRDTGIHAYEALCKTINELGGEVPTFADFVHDYSSDFAVYYQSCGVTCEIEQIRAVYTRHLKPHDLEIPFPDVHDFLVHMNTLGIGVAVVSSHEETKLRAWLAQHQIKIKHVIGGSTDKAVCLKKACSLLGGHPNLTCYVGDWGLDMRAARAAGLTAIGVTRGHNSRAALLKSGADMVVDHLDQVARQFVAKLEFLR